MATDEFIAAETFLDTLVTVTVDRPLGISHPSAGFIYPVNYGYLRGVPAPDGDDLDAYILGIFAPVNTFSGKCIAVVRRINEQDDKLIVVSEDKNYSDEQIYALVEFQERFFESIIVRK